MKTIINTNFFSPASGLRLGFYRQAGPAWTGVAQRKTPQRLFQEPSAKRKFLADSLS